MVYKRLPLFHRTLCLFCSLLQKGVIPAVMLQSSSTRIDLTFDADKTLTRRWNPTLKLSEWLDPTQSGVGLYLFVYYQGCQTTCPCEEGSILKTQPCALTTEREKGGGKIACSTYKQNVKLECVVGRRSVAELGPQGPRNPSLGVPIVGQTDNYPY